MEEDDLKRIQFALNDIYAFKLREIEELLNPLPVGPIDAGGVYDVYVKFREFREAVTQKNREVGMMRQLNEAYKERE